MSDDYIASEAIGRRACLTCERCRFCCGCSCAMRGPVVPEHCPRVVKIENSVTDNTCMMSRLLFPLVGRSVHTIFNISPQRIDRCRTLMIHASCIGMPYIVGLASETHCLYHRITFTQFNVRFLFGAAVSDWECIPLSSSSMQ